MKHLQDIIREGLLDVEGNDENMDHVIMREVVEKETGWTLSSDDKYILSGTKHFPAEVDTQFGKNKVWFENLVNCAKKYKLKIQPFGLLVLDSDSIHLLEDADIEYICELKIYVNNPVKIDLSKIKSPVHRIMLVDKRNSYCDIDSIILPKTAAITTNISLYTGASDMENIKDMNCQNLIISNGRGVIVFDIKQKLFNPVLLQQLVNNNPNVDNFYVYVSNRTRPGGNYVQVKLKGREVVDIMGKSDNTLVSKGILEDFYRNNTDFKQWYEKHM